MAQILPRALRWRLGVLGLFVLAGCGGGNPTGPSNSIPNVVGTYTGNVTITFPEIPLTVTCPTSTSVTQSGSTVSIAPLVLRGDQQVIGSSPIAGSI